MYCILFSASSLCEELIISNNFALFQTVIVVGLSILCTTSVTELNKVLQFVFLKAWINSHWNISTYNDLFPGWPTFPQFPVLPVHKESKEVSLTDFVYTRTTLINVANNQTPNKTYFITPDTNFPVQGPYLYELLQNIFHLRAYKVINWKFVCLSLMVRS